MALVDSLKIEKKIRKIHLKIKTVNRTLRPKLKLWAVRSFVWAATYGSFAYAETQFGHFFEAKRRAQKVAAAH